MASFYTNKKNTKSNDEYRENWKRKSNRRGRMPNICVLCSYRCDSVFDSYVCIKNPYRVVSVSHNGHCNCFTRKEIELTKFQKIILKYQGINLENSGKIK